MQNFLTKKQGIIFKWCICKLGKSSNTQTGQGRAECFMENMPNVSEQIKYVNIGFYKKIQFRRSNLWEFL